MKDPFSIDSSQSRVLCYRPERQGGSKGQRQQVANANMFVELPDRSRTVRLKLSSAIRSAE